MCLLFVQHNTTQHNTTQHNSHAFLYRVLPSLCSLPECCAESQTQQECVHHTPSYNR
ncbi:UNVERIFIED_CONTAM: hypothetical protein FKN15_026944 [Acipenser sinensis]